MILGGTVTGEDARERSAFASFIVVVWSIACMYVLCSLFVGRIQLDLAVRLLPLFSFDLSNNAFRCFGDDFI